MLAQRSKELLARYRRGEAGGGECPLVKALEHNSRHLMTVDTGRHMSYNNADAEIAQPEISESNEIPAAEDSMSSDDVSSATDNGITQAQVYDNLKRIGELEDEKKRIQEEIRIAPSNCVR